MTKVLTTLAIALSLAAGGCGETTGVSASPLDDPSDSMNTDETGGFALETQIPAPARGNWHGVTASISGDASVYTVGDHGNDRILTHRFDGDVFGPGELLEGPHHGTGNRADFGLSQELSDDGTLLLVGDTSLPGDRTDSSRTRSGGAYLYETTPQGWVLGHTFESPENTRGFGSAVSISGDGQVVAIASRNSSSLRWVGRVFLYRQNTSGDWEEFAVVEKLEGPTGERYARDIALDGDGDVLAVGDLDWDDGSEDRRYPSAGGVHMYRRFGSSDWRYVTTIVGDEHARDFGSTVALTHDGSLLAVDDWTYSPNRAGAVFVIDWVANEEQARLVSPEGLLNRWGTEDVDFGVGLDISADGDALAISDESSRSVFLYSR